ncbi:uncharacterized protein LOC115687780 isoform X1 [Syzygium oleosum]|uniref:uncharacterized protein LOC115687780 isoform X1 n=1 Tax=Syzygium oleosum TaxID=219896 RepID=UPI0024BBC352|nr:uncharacterized protein LOC115687780 isoform X1 [Syzygium oleosum]
MGTRTNFYKNPSSAYNRDFDLSSALRNLKAYNIVTGSASLTDGEPSSDEKAERRKRRRRGSEAPCGGRSRSRGAAVEDDRPMSHDEYVEKRRQLRETGAAQVYQELTPDVLGASSSGLKLVDYGSDGSTSEKDEEKETEICVNIVEGDQTNTESNLVKIRSEQRFPLPGEPVCLVCGKYGEYICDETDDDICSLECKAVLLRTLKFKEDPLSNQSPVTASAEFVSGSAVPEEEKDAWDYDRHRWSDRKSGLSTYLCTTCQRPGHLAEDCLVAAGQNKSTNIPKDLLGLYRRCQQIGKSSSAARCNECQTSFGLATCLDCSRLICDGAGHLDEHIRMNSSHRQYYSHKLKRLVKCSKATCKVTDISDLLACHYCFDKAFDKFYDMCTASWKGAGLAIIQGSISCEDHFSWHRMNCPNAGAEDSAYIVSRHPQRGKHVQISEFIF